LANTTPAPIEDLWLFGYGSLIWRPDIDFSRSAKARLQGWKRRFWQGSHDHRGTPSAPGRVATLVPDEDYHCDGMAFLIEREQLSDAFEYLDHREKNGFERHIVGLDLDDGTTVQGVVYIAAEANFAWLGSASISEIATQIHNSVGPSGSNRDYLINLAEALRQLQIHDEHVFAIEQQLS
jgi:glutathione-specific gamma-glutamylcyclotransferase